jgi:hypothetical protein
MYRLVAAAGKHERRRAKTLIVVSLVFFIGIAPLAYAGHQTSPADPVDEKKIELGGTPWNPQWDEIIEKALPPKMEMMNPNRFMRVASHSRLRALLTIPAYAAQKVLNCLFLTGVRTEDVAAVAVIVPTLPRPPTMQATRA